MKEYASKPIESLSKDGELLKKMRVWSMYCNENNKQPFILALPLSSKMADFVKELSRLSEIISTPLPSLLVLYKKRREHITSEAEEQHRVKIYEDFHELGKKNPENKLYIYTDDSEHYQQLVSLALKNERMVIFFDAISPTERAENRAKLERTNRLTDFANYIIRNKVVGYPRMLKEARG